MVDALHLAVRLLHVLGMAVLVGGSAFAWYAAADSPHVATAYEWAFWGAMGLMLATGVGNLGALGAPGPDTEWGSILTTKLALVLLFVLASFPRTLLVIRQGRRDDVPPRTLRRAYAATTVALIVLVALAEVLAHG